MAPPRPQTGALDDRYRSYWVKSAHGPEYPPLAKDAVSDIVVLGAGIVGVTAALDLARSGADVTLLEARRIGSGATGYTTAKVTSLHGLTYAKLESSLGADTSRTYAEANEAGLARIAAFVDELGIDCDFRTKPNFTYSESDSGRSQIAEEVAAASRAGLAAKLLDRVSELPYPVSAAVRVDDQAEFHPLAYLHGLARAATEAGARIHERTRVASISQRAPCRVVTEAGAVVRANRVIVATHMPILDRGLYFARMHPERSYVLLAKLRTPVLQGMYLSDESPAHSLRSVPTEDGERLMVGGESHKAGQSDPVERFRVLEEWTRQRFEVEAVEHRWATQDNMPNDGLPFIGRLWPVSERILTATGFRKWGLAMGTSAAAILADVVRGTEHPWAATFSPMRLHPLAGGAAFVKENANAGFHFIADRLARRSSASELVPGEGAVVGSGLEQRAVYRDESGELHSLSARCTHLGCIVRFNPAERTWDCPCHGSRFGVDGTVVEGPAVRGLRHQD